MAPRNRVTAERGFSRGFSLVELVTVLILLSALSVAALSSFYSTDISAVQSARDQTLSAFATAQQLAMARASDSNPIQLTATATGLDVTESGVSVTNAGAPYPVTLPDGVTITTGTGVYAFDKLGRTSVGQLVLARGGTTATVNVEATGYAYTP